MPSIAANFALSVFKEQCKKQKICKDCTVYPQAAHVVWIVSFVNVHAEVGKARCQGCVVQGQAICHSLCGGEWSREEHQPGKDRILAGAEQDEGVNHCCCIVCVSRCKSTESYLDHNCSSALAVVTCPPVCNFA